MRSKKCWEKRGFYTYVIAVDLMDIDEEKTIRMQQVKICIVIVSLLFAIAIMRGYVSVSIHPEESIQKILDLRQSLSFLENLNVFLIFLLIFFNNAIKALIIILFGLLFGVIPLLFIFVNGEAVGLLTHAVAQKTNLGIAIGFLLPHGILEIPAIIIASGYGLWLGYSVYRTMRYGQPLKNRIVFAMKTYYKLIVPLLLLAAVLEAFITPLLMGLVR